jgi:hypothetical protein
VSFFHQSRKPSPLVGDMHKVAILLGRNLAAAVVQFLTHMPEAIHNTSLHCAALFPQAHRLENLGSDFEDASPDCGSKRPTARQLFGERDIATETHGSQRGAVPDHAAASTTASSDAVLSDVTLQVHILPLKPTNLA